MSKPMTRRDLITVAGAAAAGTVVSASGQTDGTPRRRILGVSCSPRRGGNTSRAMGIALDAAAAANPALDVELIELGGMTIGGWTGTGFPQDDFQTILPKLQDPGVAGLLIGSPCYFRNMSALCKAFLEQCGALRKPEFLLAGKPVGALAVGGYRHGGQELVIQAIHAAMLCHQALIVGGTDPALLGAALVSGRETNDISGDELGVASAQKLGQRIAEAAR